MIGERSAALPDGVQGAADPNFGCVVRGFAGLFPGRRFGGGALSVYLDGRPVVDVWTGWADRRGQLPWSADTGAMVFSATKGMASTVIHRLADRGLIDYDAPMAQYWPEFGANGKSAITVRVPSERRQQGRADGPPADGGADGGGTHGARAGTARLPRHHLRLVDVRTCPGRHRPGHEGARPHRVGRAAEHRWDAPGQTAGGRAHPRGADHRAARHQRQPGLQLRGAQGRRAAAVGRLRLA
jgi:hypothetical protein